MAEHDDASQRTPDAERRERYLRLSPARDGDAITLACDADDAIHLLDAEAGIPVCGREVMVFDRKSVSHDDLGGSYLYPFCEGCAVVFENTYDVDCIVVVSDELEYEVPAP